MTTPTLDYLTEARRRGARMTVGIDPTRCRCDVCTARTAGARSTYLNPTPDREGLTNA